MWGHVAQEGPACPSGACPGSSARQEALKSIAQEQRKPKRSGVAMGGVALAALAWPQFLSRSSKRWAQMWRLKSPLVGGSQESRLMGVRAGGKGSRNRQLVGGGGEERREGGKQEGHCWEKVGSKHLKGSPGQRQTLRSPLPHTALAPHPRPQL